MMRHPPKQQLVHHLPMKLISWLVAGLLLLFTARRWLFILAALSAGRSKPDDRARLTDNNYLTSVLILVPARNEANTLPLLLTSLGQLTYPRHLLMVILIDDGSTDNTGPLMRTWSSERENWHTFSLPQTVGKAQALNRALARFTAGELVVIYDADERLEPDSLCRLVAPFADQEVGAVGGRRAVGNPLCSPATIYTTYEGLVHQLVTMGAKDQLDLSPAVIGSNCAYRRAALATVGAFKNGALLEDSDLSLKLPRAGWKMRFVPDAISYHHVPESVKGYWRQHTRWARGFNEVAKDQGGHVLFERSLPWLMRLELLAFSMGYLDRLALAAAAGLLLLRRWSQFPGWVLTVSLMTPLFQTMAALKLARAPLTLWRNLFWLPLFFGLDLAMVANGFWQTLKRAPQHWEDRRSRC